MALVAGHLLATIYHQVIRRDRLLGRMAESSAGARTPGLLLNVCPLPVAASGSAPPFA
ncbi:hypothetical protein [Uliginosibacterium sp. TH139]|uniref:hypothetical protein n=1 Tax=Uliginosibacterium sp. TH139 TaxID=2067453 RepID=UPI00352F7C97